MCAPILLFIRVKDLQERRFEMEDSQILELYFARSEDAIAETDKKYGRYCTYIADRILENEQDSLEVKNDTYLQAWNTIPPKRPEPLKFYLGALCRNIAINRRKAQKRQKRDGNVDMILDELSECILDPSEKDGFVDGVILRDALNRFVLSLPERTQKAFLLRYWYACTIAEVASELSIKESHAAVLLLRTREKLKEFLEKEGFVV
jgi:RNA polymerase sigma-70 factor (ECF subfamily)